MKTDHIKTPFLTVDAIIKVGNGIVLIKRKNPPYGWALPGGFVEYGESLEDAVIREVKEETSLDIFLEKQLHTYSDPARDNRCHTVTTVYIASAIGTPIANDDAKEAEIFDLFDLPDLAFDHGKIINDYMKIIG